MKQQSLFLVVILILLLSSSIWIPAQEIIAPGGDYHTVVNGSLTYTLGEPVIETYRTENHVLTQGFQQTGLTVATQVKVPESPIGISVFPNPVSESVRLNIDRENISGLEYHLLDMNGKLLMRHGIEGKETRIHFKGLPPASYILKITEHGKEIAWYKLAKTLN